MRLLALLLLSCAQAHAHQPHYVKSLPGYPGRLPVRLHSGYIALNSSAKKLFYILTESAHATDDPLVRSLSIFLCSIPPVMKVPNSRDLWWSTGMQRCMQACAWPPVVCPIAGSVAQRRPRLLQHDRIHTRERTFHFCGEACKDSGHGMAARWLHAAPALPRRTQVCTLCCCRHRAALALGCLCKLSWSLQVSSATQRHSAV